MNTEIEKGVDGLYAVCFKNYKSYDEKKIREVFGRYGNVVSVRYCGPDHSGMVFVRYKDYEETKNCLEELNKTKELIVRMGINKKTLQDAPNQQSGSPNGVQNMNNNGGRHNGPKKNFQKNYKQNDGQKKNIQPKHHSEDDSPKKNERDRQNGEKNVSENFVSKKKQPLQAEKALNNTTKVNGKNSSKRKVIVSKTNGQDSGNEGGLRVADSIQQNNNTSNGINDAGPPPLVGFEEVPDLVDGRPKVYAKDVILANFPPTFNENDIMSLARRVALKPVHISPIEVTGVKYNLPFCHLYVENQYDAEIAEVELKGTYIAGLKLIVVQAEKLLNGVI